MLPFEGSIMRKMINIAFIYIKHVTEETDWNKGDEEEDTWT